jgi:hypothetical protein
VEASRKEQKTEIWLYYTKGHVKTGKVAIKLELFQGDSLSPLLFCLALIPLTKMLNKREAGYKVKGSKKVNHLFYMVDLKLFSIDETVTARAGHCQNI